jgi:hypothetical protein
VYLTTHLPRGASPAHYTALNLRRPHSFCTIYSSTAAVPFIRFTTIIKYFSFLFYGINIYIPLFNGLLAVQETSDSIAAAKG